MKKERLQKIFESDDEAVLLLNQQGDILFHNSLASQLFSITDTPSTISVFSYLELDIHPLLKNFLQQSSSVNTTILQTKGIIVSAAHVQLPIRLWLSRIALSQGEVCMMVAEKITSASDGGKAPFYKAIADQTQDIISVYNKDFNCLYINRQAHKQLGYLLADYYTGRGFLKFVEPAYRETLLHNIEKDTQKGEISSEYRYITRKKSGELVEITNYITRIFTDNKQLYQLVANERVSMVDANAQTYNQTSETFILADADYMVSYISPNAKGLPESSNPPTLFSIIHPEDHSKLRIHQLQGSGRFSMHTPLRLQQTSNTYKTIDATIDRFFNAFGQLVYLVIRWSAPNKNDSEELLEQADTVYHEKPIEDTVIFFYHDGFTIQYVSPSVEKVLGYTPSELLGQNITEVIHPNSVNTVKSRLQAAISQSVPNLVCQIKRKDRTYQPFQVAFKIIEEEGNDGPRALFTIMHAMSSTNPPLFHSILDHLPDAVFLLRSNDLTILEANPSACALIRREHSALVGSSFLPIWMPKQAERLQAFLTQNADFATKDINYTTVEGHSFWGNTTLKVMPGADQREDMIVLRIIDITERKKRELELKRAQDASQETMRSHENFLSQMSHEIRTPLNAVLGMTHLMLQSDPREDQMKLLQTLKFSGDSLTALINDILDFSKMEAGQLRLENKEFGLMEFIQGIKLTYKNLANDRGVMFRLLLEDEVPNFVSGDVNRLGQVLNNLLNNAVKFTEEGKIVLSVCVEKETADQYILLFEVADTGIGIPKDKLSIIFDPYQQAGPNKYGGTGLGLSIVKNLVELQGGKIAVRSSEGEGTTFKVTLPFGKSQQQGTVRESTVQNLIAEFQSLEGLKVLYVEDVIPNQLLMEGLSDKWNVKLDTALNGLEALQKVKKQQYDLILMDIQMPKMDGYEAAMEIRNLKDPHYENIPIIALTASVSDKTKHRIREMGMNDYIPKPIDPKNLHQKLAELAKKRSTADSAPSPIKEVEAVTPAIPGPDFRQLNELYLDDTNGYIEILEQIRRLTLECFPVITTAIRRMDEETLRFNCHKIMSYVRLLHLNALEALLNQAKEYVSGNSPLVSADRLLQQLTRHFDKLEQQIATEITTHS
uniref:histidine kinase n=1 Tax=Roseihalotalea indica TaxID=2867963 RepID=A0AA49JF21_9BACT|nr:PAS domain S-box protein [Tunicatimonas sp. TK19036]